MLRTLILSILINYCRKKSRKDINWCHTGVTPMSQKIRAIRRTLWICPKCKELNPTRHESVVRHIGRKHRSMGEPISINTGETRHQMLISGSLSQTKNPSAKIFDSARRFSDTFTATDVENLKGKAPDPFDRQIQFSQVIALETITQKLQNIINQNATIIAALAEIWKLVRTKQP
jgi:hypothetical protein